MIWEANEHELSSWGMQKNHLEISPDCSEAEFYSECIDYEKTIEECCQYDPEFIMKVEELNEKYTLEELQQMKSYYAEDLFSAKNELLTFLSVNSDNLSPEQQKEFACCVEKIEDAITCNAILDAAIEEEVEDE